MNFQRSQKKERKVVKTRNKKAQASRVFIYLLTVVITGLVLLFGYKSIVSVQSSASTVTLLNFRTAISNDVEVDSSYGTVKVHSYDVSADFNRVCLIEIGPAFIANDPGEICDATAGNNNYRPVICDSWSNPGVQQNLFLMPGGTPFFIGNITFGSGEHHFCTDIKSGRFRLRFRGLGDRTQVEAVE